MDIPLVPMVASWFKALREMAAESAYVRQHTPHDLRSTMKSHMRTLGVPRDISEMCFNHTLPGVEGIYDRHTYFDARKEALEKWARFLVACEVGGNGVPIGAAKVAPR